MVFINALDDPIVPEPLLTPIKEFACELKSLYGKIERIDIKKKKKVNK